MKSRVSDHASGPSVGTFSTPTLSFGIGELPAGDGHFAGRLDHRALRDNLLRLRDRELQRLGERQRRTLGMGSAADERAGHGERGYAATDGQDRQLRCPVDGPGHGPG